MRESDLRRNFVTCGRTSERKTPELCISLAPRLDEAAYCSRRNRSPGRLSIDETSEIHSLDVYSGSSTCGILEHMNSTLSGHRITSEDGLGEVTCCARILIGFVATLRTDWEAVTVAVSVEAPAFIVICLKGCGFDSHCRPGSFLRFNSRTVIYGAVSSLASSEVMSR